MRYYSQRDERWKDTSLGTKSTIGKMGCLITCIGMIAEKTPVEVNDILMSVGGYANGNLVIWSKTDAVGYATKARVREYNNSAVKQAIDKYGYCLVEVDGSPIGGLTHWTVYVGDQMLIDPWNGTKKYTNAYNPIGYAILESVEEVVQRARLIDVSHHDGYFYADRVTAQLDGVIQRVGFGTNPDTIRDQ